MSPPQVVCLGEPLVALIAREPGPLRAVRDLTAHVTGAEVNVAVGLSRQGVPVSFVGRRGDDAFGERIERALRGEGIQTDRLRVDESAPTGMLARSLRTFGVPEVVYGRSGSAGSRLDETDVRAAGDEIAAARWLHVTGITVALSPAARGAVRTAVELARARGTAVSIDVNLRRGLGPIDGQREALAPLLACGDLLQCGEEEGALLTGEKDPAAIARSLRAAGTATVVVKQSAAGARAFAPDGSEVDCQARPVAVVDPVGAGDAFAAGLLAARLRGEPLDAALRAAATTAACVVGTRGDVEGLPSLSELRTMIDTDVGDVAR